jgi:quinol monooxygenase YgiN
MNARVWQLRIRPSKTQEFQDVFSSVLDLARRQEGYRGGLALASGKTDSPEVTVVALWDSLDAMRASETNLFLTQALARFMTCCEGLPHITEREILACDFIPTSSRAKA